MGSETAEHNISRAGRFSALIMNLDRALSWRTWITLGVAVLAVVVPVQSVRTATTGASVEEILMQLQKQGEPIALSEMAPDYIPDEVNAATYYRQAFKELNCPEHSSVLTNYILPKTSERKRAELEPRVRELILQNEDVFPLVRKATEYPNSLFMADWRAVTGADWSHMFPLESICNLVAARAILEARNGDVNASVADLLVALKVSRAMDADPLGISFISTLSLRYMAINGLCTVTQTRDLTPEQAKMLFDELGDSSVIPAYKLSKRGQRALFSYYFTLLRGGKDKLPEEPIGFRSRMREDPIIADLRQLVDKVDTAKLYKDQLSYLQLHTAELKLIDQPYSETMKARETMKVSTEYPFTVNLGGPFFILVSAFHTTAQINGAQTAMAVKAFKGQFGHYPTSLDEVSSSLGWKLPVDPYTRHPLSYRLDGNGFTLYSWGPNMKDDNGMNDWETSQDGSGDMIWTWKE